MSYADYIGRKLTIMPPTGLTDLSAMTEVGMFEHQIALTQWALRRGRAAIFADTGLGKTRMQLAWADAVYKATGKSVLILAPLAVAEQTVLEGAEIGIGVNHMRYDLDLLPGINITNYERLHKIQPSWFGAVVLDESSVIKHHDAKTFTRLTEAFAATPFKLCATATPAPNDWTELGTHAEFLGICTRSEMLSEFFIHDGAETQVWRLKGHARHLFWRWVSSWGAMLRKPSDLGYDDSAYELPPLEVTEHTVAAHKSTDGMLFALEAQTLSERRGARRNSLDARVAECSAMVNADRQPWIVWCDTNAESDALVKAIPDAIEIRGANDAEYKERALLDFAAGKIRVLVTKPSIAGFGLNWQHCARMAFVGVTDSFESYYQAVRRCWRFGQKRHVHVHIFASELEGAIVANLRRKERDARLMGDALSAETNEAVRSEVFGATRETNEYLPRQSVNAPSWLQTEAA
jgi:superfamily II DNA or RNA helicase